MRAKSLRMTDSLDELQRRSAALTANARALREAGEEAQERSDKLKRKCPGQQRTRLMSAADKLTLQGSVQDAC